MGSSGPVVGLLGVILVPQLDQSYVVLGKKCQVGPVVDHCGCFQAIRQCRTVLVVDGSDHFDQHRLDRLIVLIGGMAQAIPLCTLSYHR